MTSGDVPSIDVGGFDRVDRSAHPENFVRWMRHQRRAGADPLLEALGVGGHDVVLDVGCGTGIDLAALAGHARWAVGVDLSVAMVAGVRDQAPGTAAAVVADGQQLPFRTASFDACLCRAVLVHTPRPNATVGEIARVLAPGGRALFSEPDHGSHIVATTEAEIFERVKRHRRTTFRHPLIGRQLPDLAGKAGLVPSAVWALPVLHRSLAARAAGGPFDTAVGAAVRDGAISQAEADRRWGRRYHFGSTTRPRGRCEPSRRPECLARRRSARHWSPQRGACGEGKRSG